MKVKSLQMTSFRGIANLDLEFDTNEPVAFVGINGAGKSSILDCLAITLSWLTEKIQNPQESGRLFSDEDITNGDTEIHSEITISLNEDREASWSIAKTRKEETKDTSSDLTQLAESINRKLKEEPLASLPLVVYYPTNRAVIKIPLRIKTKHSFEEIAAFDQALTGGEIDFRRFFEWFKDREDLENEFYKNQPDKYPDCQLDAVRKAIYQLLDGFSNLRIERSPLQMTLEKEGEKLIVNQLSDGEKCLLAMVGDLARRLAIANPGLSEPLLGDGVVLIDEIELHLHPKWQRNIISDLAKTFPNCQFIVTTHSPQVVSHLSWAYLLQKNSEGIVVNRIPTFGKDSNRILETIMSVSERPPEIQENIRELFRLIDRGSLKEANELRQQLAEKIGEDEPKFVSADALILRKKLLNK